MNVAITALPAPPAKHWFVRFRFLEVFTFIAAAAAVFTGRQAWVAKDTETRQLRAYVLVDESAINIDADNKLTIKVQAFRSRSCPSRAAALWCRHSTRLFRVPSLASQ